MAGSNLDEWHCYHVAYIVDGITELTHEEAAGFVVGVDGGPGISRNMHLLPAQHGVRFVSSRSSRRGDQANRSFGRRLSHRKTHHRQSIPKSTHRSYSGPCTALSMYLGILTAQIGAATQVSGLTWQQTLQLLNQDEVFTDYIRGDLRGLHIQTLPGAGQGLLSQTIPFLGRPVQ